MRLIDADALIEKFEKDEFAHVRNDYQSGYNDGMFHAKVVADNFPTVDAVPVIRCKDCKHAEREDDGDIMCTFWDFCECNHHVLANGYCDRAERRKDDRRQNNTV